MNKNKLFMNNMFNYLMLLILILMIQIENMLIQWLLLEISTFLMITYLNQNYNKMPSIIYFSVSVISSFFMILMLFIYFNQLYQVEFYSLLMNMMYELIMLLKIGIFPFSYWMMYIYENINWEEIYMLSTYMKFIPIIFFMNFFYMDKFIIIMLMFNCLMISIWAVKVNYSIKKIIACSSIYQVTFMLMLSYINKLIMLNYMILYMILFYIFCMLMDKFNLHKKMDIIMFYNNKCSSLLAIVFFMYSMLPPFSSFMMKWIFVIETLEVMKFSSWFLFFTMISSILMIYNYLIMVENILFKYKENYNIYLKMNKNFPIMFYFMFSFNFIMFIMFNYY